MRPSSTTSRRSTATTTWCSASRTASEVDEVFAGLEQDVDVELERACEAREVELTEARDQEPLEDKAKAAREASKAAHEAKDAAREVERFEVKTR